MTDKTIEKRGEVGGDSFELIYSNRSPYKLDHFLTFDMLDYWIYKRTGVQREVSYQEFLDFNYCGYVFFNKNKYSNIEINKWINFLYTFVYIPFLTKPFPPIEIIDKIKIKK